MRKRFGAIVAACALALCMVGMLAGCSSSNYQPESKSPTVATPTIGQSGTLRVGVNTGKSPLAGMGSDKSKIIGIDVDVAAAIADYMGLKLSIVDVGSDPESALKDGKVDIVMGIDSSDSTTAFWLSDEYLPTGVALFALTSSNATVPTKDSNPTVAAQISSKSAWAVTNEFGDSALKTATNLSDAFNQLSSGSVNYVASDAIIGLYAAHHQGIGVSMVALLANPSGYCVGVSSSNTQLRTSVTEAVSTLTSNGTIGVIESKWLGQSLDLAKTVKTAGAASASASSSASSSAAESSSSSAAAAA